MQHPAQHREPLPEPDHDPLPEKSPIPQDEPVPDHDPVRMPASGRAGASKESFLMRTFPGACVSNKVCAVLINFNHTEPHRREIIESIDAKCKPMP